MSGREQLKTNFINKVKFTEENGNIKTHTHTQSIQLIRYNSDYWKAVENLLKLLWQKRPSKSLDGLQRIKSKDWSMQASPVGWPLRFCWFLQQQFLCRRQKLRICKENKLVDGGAFYSHAKPWRSCTVFSGFIKSVMTGQLSIVWSKNGLHNLFSVHEKTKGKKISYHRSYFQIDLDAPANQWNNSCSYACKQKNPSVWLA